MTNALSSCPSDLRAFAARSGLAWNGAEPDIRSRLCVSHRPFRYRDASEAYGRYMDDSYCIHQSKEYLNAVLACIEQKCTECGITINRRKTHIVKLSHGFTWLKKRISYGENGRIVMRPCRDSITRQRRLRRCARCSMTVGSPSSRCGDPTSRGAARSEARCPKNRRRNGRPLRELFNGYFDEGG